MSLLTGSEILDFKHNPVHVVPLPSGRAPYRRIFLGRTPTRRELAALASARATIRGVQPVIAETPRSRGMEFSAEEMVEFLETTAVSKQLRMIPRAEKAWRTIMKRRLGEQAHLLEEATKLPGYELLRRSRPRFDVAMLLAYQERFSREGADRDKVTYFLWLGASPQWRGRELLAGSIDERRELPSGLRRERRMLPLLHVGGLLRTVEGKTYALLWMLVLQLGPRYHALRAFLSCVQSMTTDYGAEHKIIDGPDVLIPFLRSIGAALPLDCAPAEFLFPHGLVAPGWHHICDGLLRFGLLSLSWFGAFLEQLKALLKFLREHLQDLTVELLAANAPAAADLLARVRLPTFAKWRWGTIHQVLKAIATCLATLTLHLPHIKTICDRSRDKKWAQTVLKAFSRERFKTEFLYCKWLADWVTGLERWCGSCSCPEHQEAYLLGQPVECCMKGRSLPFGYKKASDVFHEALAEMAHWTTDTFSSDMDFLREVSGAARVVIARGFEKFRFLDRVPYLLSSLAQEGVAQRCLDQYEEVPEHAHHRVTRDFLSPSSELRAHIETLAAGGEMHRDLEKRVRSLAEVPLDDSVGEAPHAGLGRVGATTRRANWPWQASSLKLNDNLKDLRRVVPDSGRSLQFLWNEFQRVGNMKRPERRLKCTRKQFENKIYTLFTDPDVLHYEPGHAEHGGEDDDDNMRDDDDDAPGGPPHGALAGQRAAQLKEWFEHVCEPYAWFSFQVPGGEEPFILFQLLDITRAIVKVKVYDETSCPRSMIWSIQPVELYRGEELVPFPDALTAFAVEDPRKQNMFDLILADDEARRHCREWEQVDSELEGALSFRNPKPLALKTPLVDKNVPILGLIDKLAEKGFVPVPTKIEHLPAGGPLYDMRKPPRSYLRCVLASASLFENGLERFVSGRPMGYYDMILRTRREPPKLTAKEYAKALETLPEAPIPAVLAEAPASPQNAPPGDDAVSGGEDQDEEMPPVGPPTPPADEEQPPAHDDISGGEDSGDDFPTHVLGVRLAIDNHLSDNPAVPLYYGFKVTCPYHPGGCRRYRSKFKDTERYGRRAPAYFIGCWLHRGAGMTRQQHQDFRPTLADVDAFLALGLV